MIDSIYIICSVTETNVRYGVWSVEEYMTDQNPTKDTIIALPPSRYSVEIGCNI